MMIILRDVDRSLRNYTTLTRQLHFPFAQQGYRIRKYISDRTSRPRHYHKVG